MSNISFKYHDDGDHVLVQFYNANHERIKPLEYITALDNDTLTEHEAVWLRRLKRGLLNNIAQFNRRVDANNRIKKLNLLESVLYLLNLNAVRNAKTGIKIKASMLNVN